MKHLPQNAKETIRLLKKTTEKIVDPRTSCLKTMIWYWGQVLTRIFRNIHMCVA